MKLISNGMKKIKFYPELAELIRAGKKSTTWRLFDDKNTQKGDQLTFTVTGTGEVFGEAVITDMQVRTLGTLTDEDWDGHERFSSPEEMYTTYQGYYDREVDENTEVKILKFDFSAK